MLGGLFFGFKLESVFQKLLKYTPGIRFGGSCGQFQLLCFMAPCYYSSEELGNFNRTHYFVSILRINLGKCEKFGLYNNTPPLLNRGKFRTKSEVQDMFFIGFCCHRNTLGCKFRFLEISKTQSFQEFRKKGEILNRVYEDFIEFHGIQL